MSPQINAYAVEVLLSWVTMQLVLYNDHIEPFLVYKGIHFFKKVSVSRGQSTIKQSNHLISEKKQQLKDEHIKGMIIDIPGLCF